MTGLTGENRALRNTDCVDRVTGVDLADGRHLPADVVVVGIGGVPNIEWLRDSGLELGNGVLCGANGQTNVPHVVAVGDCAAWHDMSTGTAHRVEHWTGALERPAIAVATLLAGGIDQGAAVKAPYFWSDQYGSRIQFAGIAAPDDEITIEEGSCDDAASSRRTGATVGWSPFSASTSRVCSPAGAVRSPRRPPPSDHQPSAHPDHATLTGV